MFSPLNSMNFKKIYEIIVIQFTRLDFYVILISSNKAYRNLFVIDLYLFHCYSISLTAVLYWGASSAYATMINSTSI